jgi:hypothetical protein
MKTKKLFMMFAIAFSVFAISGLAFAANNVGVNVTSEPIHAKAVSDKGGGFTLTFDEGTVLSAGDQITADLTYGVTLAKNIDIEISAGGSENPWTATVAGGGNVPTSGGPVIFPTGAVGGIVVANGGVYFHVSGTAGTQRITIDVLGAAGASLTIVDTTTDADVLKLYFLDQQTNAGFAVDGIYIDDSVPADGVYDADAAVGDNTLCINVSQYDGNTVLASFDSKNDKFTFVPSNPEVAHVVSALTIGFAPCKGQAPGYIQIGDRITQGSDTCDGFDNETGYGFCSYTHVANQMIIGSSAPFDLAQYQVKMEILVHGQSGDNGVYWSNQSLWIDGFDTQDDACASNTSSPVTPALAYELANGSPATPEGMHSNSCDVEDAGRAVVLTTAVTDLSLVSTNDFLGFDMPAFNYDLDDIQEGDVVSVRVTITKVPCGEIFTGTWQIGTFGCQVAAQTAKLLFPYFTEASADSFWDGIAIVNGSGSDGQATLTVYEADGDVGTMTVDVKAHSSYVNLLSAMVAGMTLSTSVDGTLGNAKSYIVVTTTFVPADGFAMMAEAATGQSMGYLPRANPEAVYGW